MLGWTSRRLGSSVRWRDLLRLLPDVVRLLRRLAHDRTLPRRVRVWLWLLLGYLLLPLDLVPDFLPVIGYADDAVVVVLALRLVVRSAGPSALDRHWPGTPEGLALVRRAAGLGGEHSGDGVPGGMTETPEHDRVDRRAELLPEEEVAGSDDPEAQAEAILAESDERTQHPEETRHDSTQTPD